MCVLLYLRVLVWVFRCNCIYQTYIVNLLNVHEINRYK